MFLLDILSTVVITLHSTSSWSLTTRVRIHNDRISFLVVTLTYLASISSSVLTCDEAMKKQKERKGPGAHISGTKISAVIVQPRSKERN